MGFWGSRWSPFAGAALAAPLSIGDVITFYGTPAPYTHRLKRACMYVCIIHTIYVEGGGQGTNLVEKIVDPNIFSHSYFVILTICEMRFVTPWRGGGSGVG